MFRVSGRGVQRDAETQILVSGTLRLTWGKRIHIEPTISWLTPSLVEGGVVE